MAEDQVRDYVRVKRKNTTIFLYFKPTFTALDLYANLHVVLHVPLLDMRLYLDPAGEVKLDDNKTLAEQKISNDQELYLVYKKDSGDEWEPVQIAERLAVET